MRRGLAPALLLIGSLPAAAQAQSAPGQCHLPPQIDLPAPPVPDGPRRVLPMRGYTLALSWSPEFCKMHRADRASAMQCGGRLGRFGFILHGLWPESAPEQWPQWCGGKPVSAETLRRNLCLSPSPALLAHEWAKHGSCMARSPEGYFGAGAALLRHLRLPDMARLSHRKDLHAGDLRRAMMATTPFLPPAAISVKTNARGWLEELHVC